jgi:hypothetical protein
MSVINPALGRVYGIDVIENQVSGYYLADEILGTYRGMMIAIDDAHWVIFRQMTPVKLASILKELAGNVKLSAFRKHPRGPKKQRPKRKSSKNALMYLRLKYFRRETNESTTLKGLGYHYNPKIMEKTS